MGYEPRIEASSDDTGGDEARAPGAAELRGWPVALHRVAARTPAHRLVMIVSMEAATTLSFVSAARMLARAARMRRLTVPSFRSPPRLRGADRSLRRAGTTAIVSVRVRDRPIAAVVADMIEGIIAANRLTGVEADRARAALWAAVEGLGDGYGSAVARVA